MQPSTRLDRIPPYAFAELNEKRRRALERGVDVISLGVGDPDRPTPSFIIERLAAAARDPKNHQYPDYEGSLAFRRAVAAYYARRYGVELDPATEVMAVIGSKEGLAHLVWAFCDPGDAVLVTDPGYPVPAMHALLAGGRPVALALTAGRDFLPDFDAVADADLRTARLLFLNYPNNPTGAVADRAFFERAVAFCREHGLLLVHDAAYAEITFDGFVAPSPLQVAGARECVVEFGSLSKPFNMTGWRIGFACGSPSAVGTLGRFKDNIDSKQFPAVAEAAAFALLEGDNSATMDLYKKRRGALVGGLNSAGWKVEPPQATFYVWARVPTGETSADFAKRLLEEASVLVIPGTGYGENGEGYVRMSLTVRGDVAGERLAEAARRMAGVALGRV